MSIKLKIDGFDDLLKQIESAGGTIDKATEVCLKESADIMQAELKKQMQASDKNGTMSGLIGRMPNPTFDHEGNRFSAHVGYEKGDYNPKKLSDGYKVVFLNYGTPRRSKHGKIKARGFIQKAKDKAKPQIKKAQEKTLNEILARLKR